MSGYLHHNRVRRPSERIMLKHSFSNFKNTKDNPVLVDMQEDGVNVCHQEEEGIAKKKSGTFMEIDSDNETNVRSSKKRKVHTPAAENTYVKGVELLMEDLTMANKEIDKGSAKDVQHIIDSDMTKVKHRKTESSSCSRRTRSHTRGIVKLNTPQDKGKSVVQLDESTVKSRPHNSRRSSKIKTKLKISSQKKREKKRLAQRRKNSFAGRRQGLEVLRTRTSPKVLHDTIMALNNDQKETVRKMGLESLLSMEMDGVPTKLGFFIIDNLDTNEMGIRVTNGLIPVTVDSINKLTGLPKGGIDLLDAADIPSDKNLISVWKKQFKVAKIRPKHVVDKIIESNDSGFQFKINFLVLFVNIMIESNSMGTVNLNFLSKLGSDEMIGKVDWCKYLYDRVKTSKQRWKRDNLMCFYSRPLTYLTVLYVDSTLCASDNIEKKGHGISVWNMIMLKKREKTGLQGGGFGLLQLKNMGIPINVEGTSSLNTNKATMAGQQVNSSSKDAANIDVPVVDDTVENPSNVQTVEGSECSKGKLTDDVSSKRLLIKEIEDKISRIIALKVGVDIDLESAMTKYQGDFEFIDLRREIDVLFNAETNSKATPPDAAFNDSSHVSASSSLILCKNPMDLDDKLWDSPTFLREVDETVRSIEGSKCKRALNTTEPPKFDNEVTPKNKIGSGSGSVNERVEVNAVKKRKEFDPLDFDLGISPVKKAVPISVVKPVRVENNEPAGKGKGKAIAPKKEIIGDGMGAYGMPEIERADNKILGRASKRDVKPEDHLKSPFVNRVVDFNVTTDDDKVHDWAVAMFGSKYDAVFSAINCTNITRTGMESLAVSNMTLDTSVINAWTSILNFEERLRSRSSLRRYFFRVDIMMDHMFRTRCHNIDEQYSVFRQAIASTTRHCQGHIYKLKEIDMAFFPILDGPYYYLVVINLKTPSFLILDNRKWKKYTGDSLKNRYGGITEVLVTCSAAFFRPFVYQSHCRMNVGK